ncbi:hypothetical protein [Paenibacillus pini]|uniref:hypothetical protein n=1 Tax=Paenibacillus pini TaxID=669461 RepID=UPI00055F017C|nr:hypothetical protein [Paenibacillus pini]
MANEEFRVIGDLYNRIFVTPSSHIDLLVHYNTWNQIFANLPKTYKLPDMPVLLMDQPTRGSK